MPWGPGKVTHTQKPYSYDRVILMKDESPSSTWLGTRKRGKTNLFTEERTEQK